ncbi:MAG: zinc ABC transporter substrate-binding protein [Alcanivoracaceae bacterium]|nr:zinc ABC transporter substrate-binding protein [Alcanivoracaceae bacterium]
MRTLLVFVLLLISPLSALGAEARPRVLASIEPLAMLLREVLGETVTVDTFLLPSQTPHDSSFTPSQARKVQQADLIVWLGEDAEPSLAKLMARTQGDELAMLSLEGIYQREMVAMEEDHGEHHDHNHEDHNHGPLDPHLWLSPDNMLQLARALPAQADKLGLARETVSHAVSQFAARLVAQRQAIQAQLAPVSERPYISHHDAWGYFAESFDLQQVTPISASTELSPGSRRFIALVKQIEQQGIRCVMAEPESRRALLERLCTGQCRIVETDPLGRDLGKVGYSALLDNLANSFARCL